MESKKARLKFIRNWIDEADNEINSGHGGLLPHHETYNDFNFVYRYVEKDATAGELADQFLHVLQSANGPGFHGPDWKVEIVLPDRNCALYIASTSNELACTLHEGAPSAAVSGGGLTARLAMPFEDLRQLTNFETDFVSVLTRNKRVDNPDKPLIRPIVDLFFCTYNLHHLKPEIRSTLIGSLYRTGKVTSLSGVERFLYPWAISADIGNILYELITKNGSKNSLEIGLAYGLSALFICQAHKSKNYGRHTAVDPCQSVEFQSIGIDQVRKAGLIDGFRLLEEKDYDILPVLTRENEKFDFIFIDGLHMHDYVVLDYFYSDLILDVGGILVFDDCHAPGVSSAVAYLEKNRNYRFEEQYSDIRVRVYRKLSEDSRTINDSNYHVEYSRKYFELAGMEYEPTGLPDGKPGGKEVAIVGIDAVLPSVKSIEEFWRSIAEEKTLYGTYSSDYLYERRPGTAGAGSVVGGMIESPFGFDPDFFRMSQSEAELMDPQLRHLLMSVHRCIEDSGYRVGQLSGRRVGVFIGSEGSDYNELHRTASFESGYFLNHSSSSIANRISYHFDFKGPSVTVNTMCSSGAFCVYRAVESLRKGEIDFAVVGAATMHFSDVVYQALTRLNITTPKASCYSFHRDSEGYIRSEGVVTLLLTSSRRAADENDFVYAKIKETAVNFNGRDGNSMFSPSKNGQKEVMKDCFRKAGVSVKDVAYIEAQGMGNEISDYVEFNAINEACEELLKEEHASGTGASFRGPSISTIKPILGHMECVSALGALLKIIFSFQTGIVYRIPRLERKDINQKLGQVLGPCELLTENRSMSGRRPVLAGLNSFGASGTNVHILLEEGMPLEARGADGNVPGCDAVQSEPALLILSAKSEESLIRYVNEISAHLDAGRRKNPLFDLCYTFQTRREHYDRRVMFYIEKAPESIQRENLLEMLSRYTGGGDQSAYIRDNRENSPYYHGTVQTPEHDTPANKALFEDGLSWLSGRAIDWRRHYAADKHGKLGRLPAYPFSLKPCRLELSDGGTERRYKSEAYIHPLLHRNTSDFDQQSYSTTFTGKEFFLEDHRVDGRKILPAVAYLEMAFTAVARAAGRSTGAFDLELRDLVWMRPAIVSESKQVTIALFAGDTGQIEYEVFSTEADDAGNIAGSGETIHCQGKAVIAGKPAPAPLNLEQLRAEMRDGEITPDSLYHAYSELGIDYGASHRGVTAVYKGERQLLAHVRLPDIVPDNHGEYLLHPSLIDSALQAVACLSEASSNQASLPFALDSVRVVAACPEALYAWVRYSDGGGAGGNVVKLDVDLFDTDGNVCVQMRGLSSRLMERVPVSSSESTWSNTRTDTTKRVTADAYAEKVAEPAYGPDGADAPLRARSVSYFQTIIAQTLKTPSQRIEPSRHFSEYGLDSVMVVQLTNRLREAFTDITSTLFFEVQSIDGLVNYFLVNRKEALLALVSAGKPPAEAYPARPPSGSPVSQVQPSLRTLKNGRKRFLPAAHSNPRASVHDVAIIGLSGRYPQSYNVNDLWKNISGGVNCITEIPKDRWNWEEYYDAEKGKPGKIYSKWGGFIEDIDKFDPLFFRISPLEAEQLDPQERLFIQTCYHAIEDAGYTPGGLDKANRVGVFVGVTNSMYTPAPDHFSFANRISYLFNFQGPSMSVDTACSSSLTAIHLALESIYSGLSACAIAGGVNVLIDPAHYLRLSETTALSADNQCKSFGSDADGFIDAEGVGAVVLKPLARAERDGDNIYGVIKGSAINAGGKTNGYTVPNPGAQAALVSEALERAGLIAEQISYIEAHGTGTPLGDPIEVAGLTRAFNKTTGKQQFCAIGSLKSNIGHCESAAGIAGLTKVLLQFKHQQLVPSLHAEVANAEIDFSQTPFRVQQKLERWQRPVSEENGVAREIPRTAGISSFGMGGANAHVIVQEYSPAKTQPSAVAAGHGGKHPVVLSARTAEQLTQKARDLLEFIAGAERPPALPELAYTLQVGREAMDERLAILAGSLDELSDSLRAYVDGGTDIEDVYRGRVKRDRDGLNLISQDEDMREAIGKWMARRKFSKLLDLWVDGLELDWRTLYGENRPRRISLPVYPFARERYWVEKTPRHRPVAAAAVLHPLLHQNTSDLSRQRYSSTFTGGEFFLTDHQVQGRNVLPAVAYLEMARAAVELAWPEREDAGILELHNVVWGHPLVVAGRKTVTVALSAGDSGFVDVEIQSLEDERQEPHCQGRAAFRRAPAPARLDIPRLQARLTRELAASELYAAFARLDVRLGPAHRSLAGLKAGEGQLLARLRLPDAVAAQHGEYTLHPSLLDGALQAALGLLTDLNTLPERPPLPFALDMLRIHAGCAREMFAWVRHVPGSRAGDKVVKLDIDLCDREGTVCVELRGFSARTLTADLQASPATGKPGVLFATPVWEAGSAEAGPLGYDQHHVMLCELPRVNVESLEASLPGSRCRIVSLTGKNMAERYSQLALECFGRLQQIFRDRPQGNMLVQLAIADTAEAPVYGGVSGLLHTAMRENPRLSAQLVLVDPGSTAETLAALLRDNRGAPGDSLINYRQGRQVLRWREVQPGDTPPVAFKDRGVYLITGGLGGLGRLFAREILRQTRGATVILTGRLPLDDARRALLQSLSASSGTVEYRPLDLENPEQVQSLVTGILKEYRQLNGILHSAGMHADNFILKKPADEFSRVLAPKVAGAYHLDQASREVALDFMVLFSSAASTVGNAGQTDYAAANGFLDGFAAYRNRLAAEGQRRGHTLAIHWPLWEEGGMQPDAASREMMQQAIGMLPMQTATGLRAFYQSLALQHDRVLVMEGELSRLRRTLFAAPPMPAPVPVVPETRAGGGTADLVAQTEAYLSGQFSELLKLPPREIDPRAPLENYGIDSILAMKLTGRLEETFGSLSKTLFFEYQTINQLAAYFAKAYPETVQAKVGIRRDAVETKTAAQTSTDTGRLTAFVRPASRFADSGRNVRKEVAIVGVGGRYPQADNLEAFWDNLKNGRDCITEIPPERWNHGLYFDPVPNRAGKSYSKWGGFINDVDKFDPLFFNMSPKEAELTDPQERLFIETVWQTVEDAGYSKESLSATRVGVYVGVMWGHYELFGAESASQGKAMVPNSSYASIANRVSYFFNFQGPSMAVDTMCSSSLTAIHLAGEEIRRGEIDAAIAGGVNVSIHPVKYLNLAQGNFASSDGRCRSFGEGGDGYVPGEGVGAVLLKSVEKAVQDGDRIYAVIKSSAINHGGKTNGYTVPNPNAQADLIAEALRKAGIDPGTLGYIEAHGTGTSLGDPIEVTGLTKAFENVSPETAPYKRQFCPIGSVKSNIGHLESAAGIAAVTKILLQIKHRQLVPSLHADALNPNIRFTQSPFYVQTGLREWESPDGYPRRAGVSSFGAGGANAHLILEEFIDPGAARNEHPERPEVFVLSAKDREALLRYAEKTSKFLEQNPDLPLVNAAYTSQVGRTPMNERLVIVATGVEELNEKLAQWLTRSKTGDNGPAADGATGLQGVFYGNVRQAGSGAGGLMEGEAGKAYVQVILQNRDLEKIARLWVSGVGIDWPVLYRHERPKRVSLPTYPFARERCWISSQSPFAVMPTTAMQSAPRVAKAVAGEKQRRHYVPLWKAAPTALEQSGEVTGPVLVLDETDELFLAVKTRLEEGVGECPVMLVKPGTEYREIESGVFTVDPRREEDFHRLVENLKACEQLPRQVLHRGPSHGPEEGAYPDRHLNHGLYALFHLCKALIGQKVPGPLQILSIYSANNGPAAPLNAALGGFFKTLGLENPKYRAKVVEIQNDFENSQAFALEAAGLVFDELRDEHRGAAEEIRYQYRPQNGIKAYTRFVREIAPYYPLERKMRELPLKQNGTYIITGGLGGLGFIFGEYLVKNFRCNLVVLGRSALTPGLAEKIARLEAHDTGVLYLQADVSSLEDVEAAVGKARSRFSTINGVIHSAGINRDSYILRKTREEMQSVLAPKVNGTFNLDWATSNEKLDLFVLFSSVAGVLGNPGQCDYAYANHFLDSFSEYRESLRMEQKRFGKTLSINWPLWEAGGMSVSRSDIELGERQTGISPLPDAEGIQYWEEFLQSGLSQGIALYGVPAAIETYVTHGYSKTGAGQAASGKNADPAALITKTENHLKSLIGGEIKLAPERIDSRERFESFGIDSVVIGRLNAALEHDLGALPKTLFYEYETVAELADYLVREKQPVLNGLFDLAASRQVEFSSAEANVETGHAEVQTRREIDAAEKIAIIGIHGRFPHSESPDEYWENLKQGRELIDPVPASRWDCEAYYHSDPDKAAEGKIYCKWGGFLDDVDKFDPLFFGISHEEARSIDPQERIFLQSVWAAVEDAGYTRERLKRYYPKAKSADVGVFAGVTTNSYHMLMSAEREHGRMDFPSALPWSIANRVSYFFDFQGPSMPVDTACSSSLVAVHLACESLRKRECRVAVAGGVNLYLHPSKYQSFCRQRMVSASGKCHSFGGGDDGFVPGEGVGTLFLKPLSAAIEDRDNIYAVISGSAFEHSGRSNGYSAPNPNSQAKLIDDTLSKAGVHPETIGYIEGHGTGTRMGDSLEITALTRVFERQTEKKQFCSIGSVKANVGHSESAAGMAGIIKVLLQMKHRQLVPTINSDEPNPDIDFEVSPFYLQHAPAPWESSPLHPRRALVNGFGAGGVNACVVLEEHPRVIRKVEPRPEGPYLIVLSARDENRLREYVDRLLAYLAKEESVDLADLSYTLQTGREAMQERLAVVVSQTKELVDRLSDWSRREPSAGLYRGCVDPRVKKTLRKAGNREALETAYGTGDLAVLAESWTTGGEVDWEKLYPENKPARISLPGYPFAKERCWVSEGLSRKTATVPEPEASFLHPLISHNTSTLNVVSFSSLLSEDKFYVQDHKVDGKPIFPGAGFLEIACMSGSIAGESKVSSIRDIVWVKPLSFLSGPQTVRTFLKTIGKGTEYEITSLDADNNRVVHSEGRLFFQSGGRNAGARKTVSIRTLKERYSQSRDGGLYYEILEKSGLYYGPGFRTIREFYSDGLSVLAGLKLPEHLKAGFDQFILHPAIIDGALQAIGGLAGGEKEMEGPYLPFALDELEIIRPVPQACYAHVQRADAAGQVNSEIRKFNIELLSEGGDVLIRMKNFYARPLVKTQKDRHAAVPDEV